MAMETLSVEQVATLLNSTAQQFAGVTAVVKNDLSDVVDFGRAIEDAMGFDNFFNALPAQLNTIRFWARPHVSFAPSVYMEAERFGAIRAMYRTRYMNAVDDPAWNLQEGQSYDPFVVHKNYVETRFWSKKVSTMIEQTIVREQIETAFRSETELMAFIGMLELARTNSHARFYDNLIMSLFQALIVMANDAGGMQKINLLTEYNGVSGSSLTAANALYNEGFIRYAIYRIGMIRDQMRLVTGLFNTTHKQVQSPEDRQKVVMISDFARAAGVYLHDAPNQFNTDSLRVPGGDIVPAWQGLGTTGALADRTKVIADIELGGEAITGTVNNVLAVVYDEWTLGVTNYRHQITSQYNAKGQYTNYFDKMYGGLFVSPDENVVIFTMG